MEFSRFVARIQEHFQEMTKGAKVLFETDVDKEELWRLYLDSFPEGTNEVYRKRRVYDCARCRQFMRAIGNVVAVRDNEVHTIWEIDAGSPAFQAVADALDSFVKAHKIRDVYVTRQKTAGVEWSFEAGGGQAVKITRYPHLYLELPSRLAVKGGKSEGDIRGDYRETRQVFKRSLDEISQEAVLTVLELIAQNSLYKGEEWKSVLMDFLKYKKEYDKLPLEKRDCYSWEKSAGAGKVTGRLRNHSIGVLLVNISEGMELDTAVKKYEEIVAPANYKRPKAIYTRRMLEEARKTIEELGFLDSLNRRFAVLDDITVNNILFCNRDSAKRIGGGDIFAQLERDIPVNPRRFSRLEEIGAERFVREVLPSARELEVFLERRHMGNMVSLIAPAVADSRSMFKWNNGFSWAYSGNLTDSAMKERVKEAGGNVEGVLRFSIQWNESGRDESDLDAHCQEPDGYEIFFGSARRPKFSSMGGQLDVDIIHPSGQVAVENITWTDKSKMKPGIYRFFVHQFTNRGNRNGFQAEIEFDGEIYSFDYGNGMRTGEKVQVAEVTLHENGTFSIKELLPATVSNCQIWGLSVNQFHPISVVMFSPNYWDEQQGIGHRHYMFMIKGCVNTEMPNGMFNEYLKEELMVHKKVLEALGSKCHVEDCDDQLSGLGFSATRRAELVVKVKGQTERLLRVKF